MRQGFAPMARPDRHRVLVVEDQVAVAELVHDALTEIGYAVALAATAAEALARLVADEPDLVLLDLKLPDLPGLELLDRLRAEWPKVPVVILSGTDDPILARAAMARGATAYVTKPFPLDRLREVVEVVLALRTESGGQ
jgi:two-component system KDP operon response regulator KdpE